jgi:hypothetical protein
MIIIGHPWIQSKQFVKISSLEEIKQYSANDIVLLDFLENSSSLAIYCQKNAIAYAVLVNSVKDAIFANALGAKYIVTQEQYAINLQTVATEYLFDTRILVTIENEKEIETVASLGIDGVILPAAFIL